MTEANATELAAALPPELAALDRRHVIAVTDVALPGGTVRLEHPRNSDDLITEADYVRDERLPYWADLWPSAMALARTLPAITPPPGRMLELGCGLGLVTIAGIRAGHEVVSTDYYDDALLFTRRNAIRVTGVEPQTRMADWRAWPGDLGRFDLIVASDILYEKAYAPLVAGLIAGSLAADGVAFMADPGRVGMDDFRIECAARKLGIVERLKVPHQDGAINQVITIYEIRGQSA